MRVKLGELLIEDGAITPAQLEEALRIQSLSGGLLGVILVSNGFIDKQTLLRYLELQTRNFLDSMRESEELVT